MFTPIPQLHKGVLIVLAVNLVFPVIVLIVLAVNLVFPVRHWNDSRLGWFHIEFALS